MAPPGMATCGLRLRCISRRNSAEKAVARCCRRHFSLRVCSAVMPSTHAALDGASPCERVTASRSSRLKHESTLSAHTPTGRRPCASRSLLAACSSSAAACTVSGSSRSSGVSRDRSAAHCSRSSGSGGSDCAGGADEERTPGSVTPLSVRATCCASCADCSANSVSFWMPCLLSASQRSAARGESEKVASGLSGGSGSASAAERLAAISVVAMSEGS